MHVGACDFKVARTLDVTQGGASTRARHHFFDEPLVQTSGLQAETRAIPAGLLRSRARGEGLRAPATLLRPGGRAWCLKRRRSISPGRRAGAPWCPGACPAWRRSCARRREPTGSRARPGQPGSDCTCAPGSSWPRAPSAAARKGKNGGGRIYECRENTPLGIQTTAGSACP